MASTLDLYIDTSSGQLIDGGSVVGGSLPELTRNDVYTLRLRLLEKQANGSFDDISYASSSLKAAIGTVDQAPSSGSFKLSINGVTSSAIAYNATAVSVYNAVSNNVSTVSLYGQGSYGAYLLTATGTNTAMSFSSDSFTLFPNSSVLVGTRRNPATGVQAQQVVKLVRNPIVYSDTFTSTSTTSQVALTLLQEGSSTQNETYELSVGSLARGGSFNLVFGGNATTAIPLFNSAVSVQSAISAGITSVTSNVSVQENGSGGYIISFTGTLGLTNITTALTLDSSGVQFIPMYQTSLTMSTAEVEDAFSDTTETSITPTLEIELTQGGIPKTIYQGPITIRKDLITAGSTVPGARDAYYTKSEANALFVEDSNTNVDATNRKLYNSVGSVFVDWQNNKIGTGATVLDLTGTAVTITDGYNLGLGTTTGTKFGVSTSSKLAFYGSTPVTQPNGPNVVTSLVNLGLLATGSTTYGVFPLSPKTLTATSSLAFGVVANNTSNSITVSVTGAAINDIVLLGIPSSVSEGLTFFGHVVASNQVHVDAVNATNASKTQSTQTFRITVIGY
jgi:hypothetical protein